VNTWDTIQDRVVKTALYVASLVVPATL